MNYTYRYSQALIILNTNHFYYALYVAVMALEELIFSM